MTTLQVNRDTNKNSEQRKRPPLDFHGNLGLSTPWWRLNMSRCKHLLSKNKRSDEFVSSIPYTSTIRWPVTNNLTTIISSELTGSGIHRLQGKLAWCGGLPWLRWHSATASLICADKVTNYKRITKNDVCWLSCGIVLSPSRLNSLTCTKKTWRLPHTSRGVDASSLRRLVGMTMCLKNFDHSTPTRHPWILI